MATNEKKWENEEIEFIKNNYLNMSVSEIGNRLNRTRSSVQNKKNKMGLKGERKYQYNYNFFKPPFNEYSAYWLGFIYADGYISGPKEIGIQLISTDHEHLKKLNISLCGNIPVNFFEKPPRYIKGKLTGKSELCEIRIYNKDMVEDLFKVGVTPRKSLNISFPYFLDETVIWSFIRGYFDGDGSVFYDQGRNQLRSKITCGSKNFLNSFSSFLSENNINNYITDKGGGTDCGISGKESTRIFLSKLYDDSNIYLERKYKKYMKYKHLLLPQ